MKQYEIWTGTVKISNGRDYSKVKTVWVWGEELGYYREDNGYRGTDVRVFRGVNGSILVYKIEWTRLEGGTDKASIYKYRNLNNARKRHPILSKMNILA